MRRTLTGLPAALSLVVALMSTAPATSADFNAFRAACFNGGASMLGPVPEGKTAGPVLAALCPCLEAGFASYSQPEIDALEADLRTGTSDEAEATYPAYQELQAKSTRVIAACFGSQAVMEAARAQGL